LAARRLNTQFEPQTPGAITLSTGVAAFPQNGLTAAAVLQAADDALYRAKQEARGTAVAAGLIAFLLIRQQAAISDREFLRSMIPHHAGAILMCNQADLRDPQIQELCQGIVAGQQAEIDLMKEKLAELGR
jgi:uncharacterized protein (DUF305 family)